MFYRQIPQLETSRRFTVQSSSDQILFKLGAQNLMQFGIKLKNVPDKAVTCNSYISMRYLTDYETISAEELNKHLPTNIAPAALQLATIARPSNPHSLRGIGVNCKVGHQWTAGSRPPLSLLF